MELPKINTSEGSVLGNLAGKLGIGRKDDDYDDYDDYDEEYDDDDYDDDPYGYDEPSRRGAHQSPNLVSASDVRAHGVRREESYETRRGAHAHAPAASDAPRGGYTHDASGQSFASPFQQLDPVPQYQSKGLNSLFDSTQAPAEAPQAQEPAYAPASAPVDAYAPVVPAAAPAAAPAASAYDPYDVYAGTASTLRSPGRQLVVIRPTSYNEVEQVAKALRAGDAVVLALRATRDDLAKRILDFSFGAASIAGARVDSVGVKTFVVSTTELTDAEHRQLVMQGIL